MPRTGYILGEQMFGTKELIKEHIRAVRSATAMGERVVDHVTLSLLRLHPQWEEKTENMAFVTTAMIKGTPAAKPSKQIAILNKDKTIMDISWAKLVARLQKDGSLKHPTNFWEAVDELKIAARQDVFSQIKKVSVEGMHVDHVYPNTFEQLLFDWVKSTSLSPLSIKVQANDGPVIERHIECLELRQSWQQWHQEHAVLEVVSPEDNLKRPKVTVDWETLR